MGSPSARPRTGAGLMSVRGGRMPSWCCLMPGGMSWARRARWRRHRHHEFPKFLRKIDKNVPTQLDVHVVCPQAAVAVLNETRAAAGTLRPACL